MKIFPFGWDDDPVVEGGGDDVKPDGDGGCTQVWPLFSFV
jgi:hypothetical protein